MDFCDCAIEYQILSKNSQVTQFVRLIVICLFRLICDSSPQEDHRKIIDDIFKTIGKWFQEHWVTLNDDDSDADYMKYYNKIANRKIDNGEQYGYHVLFWSLWSMSFSENLL